MIRVRFVGPQIPLPSDRHPKVDGEPGSCITDILLRRRAADRFDQVTARVDAPSADKAIRRAHSATHILHYALRKTSRPDTPSNKAQKSTMTGCGSTFTNMQGGGRQRSLTRRSKREVAKDRVARGRGDGLRRTLPLSKKPRKQGAMMLFGEKYPEVVRVVSMGDYSKELCGGTHLGATGDVGPFKITAEESISAGTRRITALTGEKAEAHIESSKAALAETAAMLDVSPGEVPDRVDALVREVRQLKKKKKSGATGGGEQASAKAADTSTEDDPVVLLSLAAALLKVPAGEVPERVQDAPEGGRLTQAAGRRGRRSRWHGEGTGRTRRRRFRRPAGRTVEARTRHLRHPDHRGRTHRCRRQRPSRTDRPASRKHAPIAVLLAAKQTRAR